MKKFKLIAVIALIFFVQVASTQVSSVGGLKPLEGVTIPKAKINKEIKPGATFKDCNECPEMVMIPAGRFLMGSAEGGEDNEKPKHFVQIQSFAIGKYEITQKEWVAVMGDNFSRFKGQTLPVEFVDWGDAQEFVIRLSHKTGKNYRLPSEAEWEYAARGGSSGLYPWGDDASKMPDYVWFDKNKNEFITGQKPVGLKKPNQFGVYDMIGNVWEWTQDCWNDNYDGAPLDGSAWITGDCSKRVIRGGEWRDRAELVRVAYRVGFPVKRSTDTKGLRVARTN